MCDFEYHMEARRKAYRNQLACEPCCSTGLSNQPPCGQGMSDQRDWAIPDYPHEKMRDLFHVGGEDDCYRTNPILNQHMFDAMNEGCGHRGCGLYLRIYKDLRRRNRQLMNNFMFNGPWDAFDDYFPPGWKHNLSRPRCLSIEESKPLCGSTTENTNCAPPPVEKPWKFSSRHHPNRLPDTLNLLRHHCTYPKLFPPRYEPGPLRHDQAVELNCQTPCVDIRVPNQFNMAPRCKYLQHMPLSYVPPGLKMLPNRLRRCCVEQFQ